MHSKYVLLELKLKYKCSEYFIGYIFISSITKHILYTLYVHVWLKFIYVWMDRRSEQTFTISNAMRWGSKGSKEGEMLKQIPPVSR